MEHKKHHWPVTLSTRKAFFKVLGCGLLLLSLTACERWGPECVEAGDFGDTLRRQAIINPSQSAWVDAEVELIEGQPLRIQTQGHVDLCNTATGTSTNYASYQTRLEGTRSTWQSSGMQVANGSTINAQFTGRISPWSSDTPCRNLSGGCWLSDGSPVYIHIGDTAPTFLPSSLPTHCTSYTGDTDECFPLKDFVQAVNSSQAASTDQLKTVPINVNGKIWFGINDNPTSDNRGFYTITLRTQCWGAKGRFLLASIADDSTAASTGTQILLHNNANTGTFNGTAPATGKLFLRLVDDRTKDWNNDGAGDNLIDGNYTNNIGEYKVDITTTKITTGATGIINGIVTPVKEIMFGTSSSVGLVQRMFENITADGRLLAIINAALVLSVILYGLGFIAGMSGKTLREFIFFIFKIAIIVTLLQPGSWEFFYKFLFGLFIQGLEELIVIMTNQFTTIMGGSTVDDLLVQNTSAQYLQQQTFGFLDQTLTRFLSEETNLKIFGLLWDYPLGALFAIAIWYGIFLYIYAVATAIIVYLTSIIGTSILLVVAPIFLIFMLFRLTSHLFDAWLKILMSFLLQPVLLLSVLGIFNIFIYNAFYYMLSFSVCWDCWLNFTIPSGSIPEIGDAIGDMTWCIIKTYIPWGRGGDTSLTETPFPVSLFTVLIFLIFVKALNGLTTVAATMAQTFVGGSGSVALAPTATAAFNQAKDAATTAYSAAKFPLTQPLVKDSLRVLRAAGIGGIRAMGTLSNVPRALFSEKGKENLRNSASDTYNSVKKELKKTEFSGMFNKEDKK